MVGLPSAEGQRGKSTSIVKSAFSRGLSLFVQARGRSRTLLKLAVAGCWSVAIAAVLIATRAYLRRPRVRS